MKFRLTMVYEYDVSDEEAEGAYETSDPQEMAEIDRKNLLDDPGAVNLLVDWSPPVTVTIVPVVEE